MIDVRTSTSTFDRSFFLLHTGTVQYSIFKFRLLVFNTTVRVRVKKKNIECHQQVQSETMVMMRMTRMVMGTVPVALILALAMMTSTTAFVPQLQSRRTSVFTAIMATPTELPDSLDDAAVRAARASAAFSEASGPVARCRVDFDTSVGDETFTILKTSTEFMQKYVSALCYAMVPGAQEQRENEIAALAQAQADLQELKSMESDENDEKVDNSAKIQHLQELIARGGRPADWKWQGPTARVYFPDEGNAALARRDWNAPDDAKVPPCVQFASCGGVQRQDISNDCLVFFFCPRAAESEQVEAILQRVEIEAADNLKLTIFVNPKLVDMGVTGFGMAGRLLRERLIEPLTYTYTLRTLQWGALTREWPAAYTVWQEDENESSGYRLIRMLDRLPSNPDVEEIYEMENGGQQDKQGGGVLNALGDFVNGMMSL
jgi:hypothetical protein